MNVTVAAKAEGNLKFTSAVVAAAASLVPTSGRIIKAVYASADFGRIRGDASGAWCNARIGADPVQVSLALSLIPGGLKTDGALISIINNAIGDNTLGYWYTELV